MKLTESQRNQITRYKIQIQECRKFIENESRRKKEKSEYYSAQIKNAKDLNTKRNYREYKLNSANNSNNLIAGKRREIEKIKESISNIKR